MSVGGLWRLAVLGGYICTNNVAVWGTPHLTVPEVGSILHSFKISCLHTHTRSISHLTHGRVLRLQPRTTSDAPIHSQASNWRWLRGHISPHYNCGLLRAPAGPFSRSFAVSSSAGGFSEVHKLLSWLPMPFILAMQLGSFVGVAVTGL